MSRYEKTKIRVPKQNFKLISKIGFKIFWQIFKIMAPLVLMTSYYEVGSVFVVWSFSGFMAIRAEPRVPVTDIF